MVAALIFFFGKGFFVREEEQLPAQKQLTELEKQAGTLQKAYKAFLENELRLPGTLSPGAALDALRDIEDLKKKIAERDNLLEKIRDDRLPFIRKFEETAETMSRLVEEPGDRTAAEQAEQVIREYDRSREEAGRKTLMENELQRLNRRLVEAIQERERIRREMGKLISAVGAKDAEELFRKYEENEKIRTRMEKRDEAFRTIENIAGLGKAKEMTAYLSTIQKTDLEEQLQKTKEEITTLGKELFQIRETLGGKKRDKEMLEGGEELAGVLTELEAEKERLREAYREWLALQVAVRVLNDVKARYEQERQPAVIRNSGRYFSRITGGRYPEIRVSLGEKEVMIFDQKAAVKKIGQLSRGTKEQLLISLRLGFIEEYERASEPLPVIVDEVLVNFDPERALRTAAILEEFAAGRQVLLFTCHPETEKLFSGKITRITV